MWRCDQTKDFTNSACCHLRRCILLEKWHPAAHGVTTVGKLHCIGWFRNRRWVQTSLQRNAKKMCPSCLPLQICYGKHLYRVWKLQNVGAVYESLTLARTKKNAGVIWNTLICIHSAHTLKIANASRLKTVFVQTRQSWFVFWRNISEALRNDCLHLQVPNSKCLFFSNKSETHYHYEYDMFHMFFQLFKVPAKSISVGQIVSFIVPPSISCAIWGENKYGLCLKYSLYQKKHCCIFRMASSMSTQRA